MLSSLIGQEVVINVATMRGNGSPWTCKDLATRFRALGVDVRVIEYEDLSQFERRGVVRSMQVQECDTDHILFADSDMVYDPTFFADLYAEIDGNYRGMYTAGRMSQESPVYADALINRVGLSLPVEDPFARASSLPLVKRSNVGAGFFQLVLLDACDGYYVTSGECRDKRWSDNIQCARSDKQFRRRIGEKIKLGRRFTHGQCHLNHCRDNMVGHHLEQQR